MEWIEEADGVFRSGGVKGLGLAGALLGFAEHPEKPVKRWVNVAGASAGAIIACYLAVGHDAADLAALLTKTDIGQFQDFLWPGEILGGGLSLLRERGLSRGDAFREWFSEQLAGKTFAATKSDDGTRNRLKLIAVDATNRALLVLPDDLPRYRLNGQPDPIDPDEFELADAARMSMSIPSFFEPVELTRDRVMVTDKGDTDGLLDGQPADRIDVGHANEVARNFALDEATYRELNEEETEQQRSVIIDGGTLSNFPVWLFDVDATVPRRPTFGFTVRGGRGAGAGLNEFVQHMSWAIRFGFDVFQTSQEAWDPRFVSHSTQARTVAVDAGDIATTQFNLTANDQAMLLANGRTAAKRFLDRFDLAGYENTFHAHLTETTPERTARAVSVPEPVRGAASA